MRSWRLPASRTSRGLHPRLTTLQTPAAGDENTFADGELETLLHDADACLAKMKDRLDAEGDTILHEHATDAKLQVSRAYVAPALALLSGRFIFRSGKPNPSAAAKSCGQSTAKPKLVTDWMAELVKLDAALAREEALAAQQEALRRRAARAGRRAASRRRLQPRTAPSGPERTAAFASPSLG